MHPRPAGLEPPGLQPWRRGAIQALVAARCAAQPTPRLEGRVPEAGFLPAGTLGRNPWRLTLLGHLLLSHRESFEGIQAAAGRVARSGKGSPAGSMKLMASNRRRGRPLLLPRPGFALGAVWVMPIVSNFWVNQTEAMPSATLVQIRACFGLRCRCCIAGLSCLGPRGQAE